MARKNSLKKRREYNDYLVQQEKDKVKEKKEKLNQLRKVRARISLFWVERFVSLIMHSRSLCSSVKRKKRKRKKLAK